MRHLPGCPYSGIIFCGRRRDGIRSDWAEYNERVREYYDTDLDIWALSDRLYDVTDFTVEVKYHKAQNNRNKKSKRYRHSMEQKLMEAEDEINRCSQKYLLIHFNVLMDMGYGKKRLVRVKDSMNQKLEEIGDLMGESAMKMRDDLIDGAGIIIEMPK